MAVSGNRKFWGVKHPLKFLLAKLELRLFLEPLNAFDSSDINVRELK